MKQMILMTYLEFPSVPASYCHKVVNSWKVVLLLMVLKCTIDLNFEGQRIRIWSLPVRLSF